MSDTAHSIPRGFKRLKPPRVGLFSAVAGSISLVLAVLSVYPLLRVLLRLVVVDGEPSTRVFSETFAQDDLLGLLARTAFVIFTSSVCAVIIGGAFAWLNERTDARLGAAAHGVALAPFLLPPIASAVGWVLLFSPRSGYANVIIRNCLGLVGVDLETGPFDIFTMYGLVLSYVVFQVPYVFLLVSAGLRNVDPALEEQSRVSGAGPFRTFWRVGLPVVKPSIGAAVILLIWFGLALFSIPSVIGSRAGIEVLSVRIVRLINFTSPPQMDAAVGLGGFMLVAVGVAWYLQTRVLRRNRHATVGGRGVAARPVRLGRWRWVARGLIVGYLLVSTVFPLAALAVTALNGFWTPTIAWGSLDLEAFREVFAPGAARDSLMNSLRISLIGAAIGIAAAAIMSVHVATSRSRWSRVVDATARLPATLGAIVVGVGIILAFAGPPFRLHGTLVILLLAYIILYLPQASVAADAAVAQVGRELPEASRVAGAKRGRTMRKVQLPIMAAGLVSGWSLLFVRMVGDLTASALLSGGSNRVVGFQMLDSYAGGTYGQVAALAIVTTVITGVILTVVLIVVRRLTAWGRGSTALPRGLGSVLGDGSSAT